MLERLRTIIIRYSNSASGLSLAVALLLFLAYLPERVPSVLPLTLAYAAVGIGGIMAEQVRLRGYSEDRLCITLALVNAFALMTLASVSEVWWMAAVALSLLLPALQKELHMKLLTGGLPLLGAVIGALLTTMATDMAVLGAGALVVGNLAFYIFFAAPQVGREPAEVDERDTSEFALVTATPTNLSELATRMLVTVDGLVRSAAAIKEVTGQQSDGADEQANVITLTNNLLDDFLKLSENINERAIAVTETAQQAAQISQVGQVSIREAIIGMEEIRNQVSAIGATIVELVRLTRRVDEIITSVSEIATQSNLLALNAAIEAARAGRHGRGFAAVADEVRSLAQQSTEASEQVRNILIEIQSAMKETVRSTEIGVMGVEAGMNRTQEANNIMVQLSENVNASHDAVNSIYDVIRQQSEGLEEISISMDRIDRITQQNLASTRMVETVSTNLTRLANDLQETVDRSRATTLQDV